MRLLFRRRARPPVAALARAPSDIAAAAQEIQEDFVRCGAVLRESAALAEELSARNRQLIEFDQRVSRREAALTDMAAVISRKLELCDSFSRGIDEVVLGLERHDARLAAFTRDQALLEQSFAPLPVVNSLFRIESANLPPEAQAVFSAVTLEMARLDTVARRSAEQQAELIQCTRARIQATASDLRRRSRLANAASAAAHAQVENALATLQRELAVAAQRNASIDAALSAINREIGTATISLQYEDITRQKLAHIEAAVPEILAGLRSTRLRELRTAARRLHLICLVQARQVADTRSDLAGAIASIESRLREVLARLRYIEAECFSREDLDHAARAIGGAVKQVAEANAHTGAVILESLASLGDAIAAARALGADATEVITGIRTLAFDIRLMGLNAQVQAVQVDSGGLQVLSSAAAAVATDAIAAALKLEREFATATAELVRVVDAAEAFESGTRAQHAALGALDKDAATAMHDEHATNRALIQQLISHLDELRIRAGSLIESIGVRRRAPLTLEALEATFQRTATTCARAGDRRDRPPSHSLAEFEARYTMQSERAAHAEALGVSATAPAPSAAAASSAGPLAPGAPADAIPPASPVPAGEAPLGANVELF